MITVAVSWLPNTPKIYVFQVKYRHMLRQSLKKLHHHGNNEPRHM